MLTKRAGHRVWVHVPQRGEKAELRMMAQRNAAEEAERATSAEERVAYTLTLLEKMQMCIRDRDGAENRANLKWRTKAFCFWTRLPICL